MSKFVARILASAVALSGVVTVASSASAATVILNISLNGNGITVVSTPADDLAKATSANTTSWTLNEIFTQLPPLTGAITSVSLNNPVELAPSALATNTLTLVIGGVTYTDHLTQTANPFDAVVFMGSLTGPGLVPGKNETELDLSYTQAFGTGHVISASATYAVNSVIPEAPTWAMMALGFAGLGYTAFRRRKTNISEVAA
jgi:hypothetical protein